MESMKNVNPNTYSSLPPKFENLRLLPEGTGRLHQYIDNATGEIWHQLTQAARTQVLVCKLIKGIIPISDTVIVDNPNTGEKMILSKVMDLDAGEVHTSSADRQADVLFLDFIFNDRDHGDAHNISKNKLETNHYFFDLGEADQMFGEDHYFRHESVDDEVLSMQTDEVREKLCKRFEMFIEVLSAKDATNFIAQILASIPKESAENEYGSYITDTVFDEESLREFLLVRTQNAVQKVQRYNSGSRENPDNQSIQSGTDILKL